MQPCISVPAVILVLLSKFSSRNDPHEWAVWTGLPIVETKRVLSFEYGLEEASKAWLDGARV